MVRRRSLLCDQRIPHFRVAVSGVQALRRHSPEPILGSARTEDLPGVLCLHRGPCSGVPADVRRDKSAHATALGRRDISLQLF